MANWILGLLVAFIIGVVLWYTVYAITQTKEEKTCGGGNGAYFGKCPDDEKCVGTTGNFQCVPTSTVCTDTNQVCPSSQKCVNQQCIPKVCGDDPSILYPCDDPTQECTPDPYKSNKPTCVGECSATAFGYCTATGEVCQTPDNQKSWLCGLPTCGSGIQNDNGCANTEICVPTPDGSDYWCQIKCSPQSKDGVCSNSSSVCIDGECISETCKGSNSGICQSGYTCLQDQKNGIFTCFPACSATALSGRCPNNEVCKGGVCTKPGVCLSDSDCPTDFTCQNVDTQGTCVPTLCGGSTLGICPQPISSQPSAAACGNLYSSCYNNGGVYSCIPHRCGEYDYDTTQNVSNGEYVCGIVTSGNPSNVCVASSDLPTTYSVGPLTNYTNGFSGNLYAVMDKGTVNPAATVPKINFQVYRRPDGQYQCETQATEAGVGQITKSDVVGKPLDLNVCQQYCDVFENCYGVTYKDDSCILYSYVDHNEPKPRNDCQAYDSEWNSFTPGGLNYAYLKGSGIVGPNSVKDFGLNTIFNGNYRCANDWLQCADRYGDAVYQFWQSPVTVPNEDSCIDICRNLGNCDYYAYFEDPTTPAGCILGRQFSSIAAINRNPDKGGTTSIKVQQPPAVNFSYTVIPGIIPIDNVGTVSFQRVSGVSECANVQATIGLYPGVAQYQDNGICNITVAGTSNVDQSVTSYVYDCKSNQMKTYDKALTKLGPILPTSSGTSCEDLAYSQPFTQQNSEGCHGYLTDPKSIFNLFVY